MFLGVCPADRRWPGSARIGDAERIGHAPGEVADGDRPAIGDDSRAGDPARDRDSPGAGAGDDKVVKLQL